MTISLDAMERFEMPFVTEEGVPFSGVLMPLDQNEAISNDFVESRQIMRVPLNCIARTGTVILDAFGRRHLLANHDLTRHYRSHRVYPLDTEAIWSRSVAEIDALTGRERGVTRVPMPNIWVMSEVLTEVRESAMGLAEQARRIITGADLKLNDAIDGRMVRKLDKAQGIWIATCW